MYPRSSDSRVTLRPLSIGLYLDQRAPQARTGEVEALGQALRDLGHRVVAYRVVQAADVYRESEPSGPADEQAVGEGSRVVSIVLPAAQPGGQPDRALRADLTALVQRFAQMPARHDLHHAFDALTAQALLVARPEAVVLRTVTNLARSGSSYHEHLSAHTVRTARAVLAPSEALCGELRARYGVDAQHVDTGVDLEAFAMAKAGDVVDLGVALKLDAAGPVLLSFGGLPSAVEAEGLLDAFLALHARYPGARWVAEGAELGALAPAVREALVAALRPLSPAQRAALRLVHRFSAAERAAAYQLADVVMCTGARDAHLSWLLEAQAAGVPLLLADEPSLREYVDPRCAAWVAPGDAEGLRRMLMRVAVAGRSDRRLVHAGYERARECSWGRSAAQHASAYRRLLFEGGEHKERRAKSA